MWRRMEALRPRPDDGRIAHRRKRFGQSTRLVELDVDRVVALAQSVERFPVVDALVSANGDRTVDSRQHLILPGGKRLFDQRDARVRAGCEIFLEIG